MHYGTFALVKGARGRDEKQLSTEVSLKEKFIWTLFLDLFLLGSIGGGVLHLSLNLSD